jgi:exodeoxyribonuclease VII large subunit
VNLDLFDSVKEPEKAENPPSPVPTERHETEEPSAPVPTEAQEVVDASQEPQVWTVSEISQAVKTLLEDQLPPLWISGEVANWKRAGSGHCYFTLKDENSQLRCVMWKRDASRLPMDPEEGMKIRVFGQITLYGSRGDLQLMANRLEAEDGEGLWRLAFEKLKKELQGEGLLSQERKRPLPSFPQSVGVVTSTTGAALHDILTVLRRRAPWLRVIVAGARVQGEGSSQEVADAIRRLAATGEVDVLIVGRGGGSIEDLWAFNEEPVARALAECPVPVVSAVGHEVDITISDLVADFRAPTPSAAAEAVAPDKDEILRYLKGVGARLAQGLRRGVDGQRRTFGQLQKGLFRVGSGLTLPHRRSVAYRLEALGRLAKGRLTEGDNRLIRSNEAMGRTMKGLLNRRRVHLAGLAGKMHALSPLNTLQRGYSVAVDEKGRLLKESKDFVLGGEFLLRVVDGKVRCEVLGKDDALSGGETDD